VDWFAKEAGKEKSHVGVIGYGEGGWIAMYAGALDSRLDAVCVSGSFRGRQNVWNEPIDRNVFGLLDQFGDAEVISLIAPRVCVVDHASIQSINLPSQGGAPAKLDSLLLEDTSAERERAYAIVKPLQPAPKFYFTGESTKSTPP